jgi:AhpD family alkylhydroperoxidase
MSLLMLNEKDPKVLQAMYRYRSEVFKEGSLTVREKELIAMVVSSMLKCEKCFDYHVEAAKAAGATGTDVLEALEVLTYMSGPSAMIWTDSIDRAVEDP